MSAMPLQKSLGPPFSPPPHTETLSSFLILVANLMQLIAVKPTHEELVHQIFRDYDKGPKTFSVSLFRERVFLILLPSTSVQKDVELDAALQIERNPN